MILDIVYGEWTFGFKAPPGLELARVAPSWTAHRWARFDDAYRSLGLEPDRAAVMRLHSRVIAA